MKVFNKSAYALMVGYELIQPGSQGELSAEEYETYKHLVEVIDEPKVEPKAEQEAEVQVVEVQEKPRKARKV